MHSTLFTVGVKQLVYIQAIQLVHYTLCLVRTGHLPLHTQPTQVNLPKKNFS